MKTLKYALRFLIRSKSYSIINLLGLALSLACSIVLARYIYQEMTVDTHALQSENIVVPLRDIDGNIYPCALENIDSVYFSNEQIVEETQFIILEKKIILQQNIPYTANIFVTDSTYFHFFCYETVAGTLRLSAPNDALITESFAHKLFGNENPIGKTFYYGKDNLITIQGVLKEPTCKTSFTFDVMLNLSIQEKWRQLPGSFLRLQPNISIEKINKISSVYRKTENGTSRNFFVPVTQFYWSDGSNYQVMEHHGDRSHVLLLMGVCLLVLLTGVINFVNLYLVLIMKRSKEYGIKKIFGAHGRTLFVQLWIENVILITCALFTAWLLIEIATIPVNRLLGSEVSYTSFDAWLSLGIWLLLPLLTCAYPFIKYNYLSPIAGIRTIGTSKKSVTTRMMFLLVQCIITFQLVILSLYLGKHVNLLLHTDPGFRQEGILIASLNQESFLYNISVEEQKNYYARMQQVRQKLDETPLIERWQLLSADILDNSSTIVLINDKDAHINLQCMWVSPKFFNMYDLKIIEGTIPERVLNSEHKIVMNESALKAFGYKHREEAFVRGETPLWISVSMDGTMVEGGMKPMPVEAIVKDYYTGHITAGKQPVVFMVGNAANNSKYQILCKAGKEKEVLSYLRKIEKDIYNTEEFEYYWQKDKLAAMYNKDRQVMGVYMVFAFIAIIISCLGLFGLSLFDIRQRYREIAIRKVNGAGNHNIYSLLIHKYVVVLVSAFTVAVPISFYLINLYTQDFIVKAPIGVGIFIIALIIISLVSIGTLLWQIRKATTFNLAETIKTE